MARGGTEMAINTHRAGTPTRQQWCRATHSGTPIWMAAFAVIAIAMTIPTAGRGIEPQDQLPAFNEPPLTQYRAFRRMHAKNEKFNQEAWLEAWTELKGNEFRYEITSERGSDYIRTKILKALLNHEQEIVSRGEAGRAEICPENYQFEDMTQSGDEKFVTLKPRRKDMLLVNGRMVLNSEGTELLRVEGTLSKNPSFWTSLVTIVRQFARVDGVRVPVSTETVAKLKFAGQAKLDVRYEYETVNGRPVGIASAARPGIVYRAGTH
jgi:hypothetical protein